MKIAIINEKYHPYISGGAEKSVKLLADALLGLGVEPEIITLSPDRGHRIKRVDGIRVHYLGLRNFYWPFDGTSRPLWQTYLYHARDAVNLPMVADVARVLNQVRPDLVHTNNLSGLGVLLWRTARLRSLPIVHTLRDYFLMCPHSARYRKGRNCVKTCLRCMPFANAYRRLSRHVHAVVGNSRYILERHVQSGYFARTTLRRVIYNASMLREDTKDRKGQVPRTVVTFAFLGRVAPEKGIEQLLEATLRLPSDAWKLLIAGDGKRTYLSHLKRRFDNPAIHWLGWVDPQHVYRNLDWVVVPSLWHEPLSRVVLEAHSCGIPVVSSRRGGNTEVVDHGKTGLLFEPDEPGALASMLAMIIHGDLDIAAVRKACLEAGERFTPERLADQYIDLYRDVLRRAV